LNIWKADKLFFHFFKNILNGRSRLLVATNSRLLKIQNTDKLFFHFLKNILNGVGRPVVVAFLLGCQVLSQLAKKKRTVFRFENRA
jgi:hypothetical protein